MPVLDPTTKLPIEKNNKKRKTKSIYDEIDFASPYISPTMSY